MGIGLPTNAWPAVTSGSNPESNDRRSMIAYDRRYRRSRGLFLRSAYLALVISTGGQAAPSLDHLYPMAIQQGSTSTVTAIGKFDPWPPKVWVGTSWILFKAQTNTGKFDVEVSTNAPTGPHLVRLFNDQGASRPRFLVVTHDVPAQETEPNDDFKKPQALERLPLSLNGRLDKSGDVDSFSVNLEAGQTLVASVEAYPLGSPVDALLRLVDSHGVQLTLKHDDGRTLDPFLAWTAQTGGTYVVQIFGFPYPATADVKLAGGNACVYRLHVSRGPFLRYTLPLGLPRGAKTKLHLFGWNMGSGSGHEFEWNGSGLSSDQTQAEFSIPGYENILTLPIGDGREWIENELATATNRSADLEVPGAVTGCIESIGEKDRFRFPAKKSEKLLVQVQSASLGFPLDARLTIEDTKGKELAKSDDGSNADPTLEWSAPEDGTFVAAVGNVLHRCGPDYLYRLSIRPAVPALKATVAESAFTVEPGKTNEIKAAVKRFHGFRSRLTMSVHGLPDSVKAESIEIPEKDGDVSLKLMASLDASPFSGSIEVLLTETDSGGQAGRAMHELVTSSVNNGVPNGFNKLLIESTEKLWLTVLPIAGPKPETPK